RPPSSPDGTVVLLDHVIEVFHAPRLTISGQDFLSNRGRECLRVGCVLIRADGEGQPPVVGVCSDPLDVELAERGIELIAPHRKNRKKPRTQDGRKLRRHKRRWKVEWLRAWLQNFRRMATRVNFHVGNFLGFVHLGCIKILLRCY
ncbi:MAG TPA: hypothetical protein VER55_05820, partial [Ardenticatenaceae bacterium]|nr:hypothetical protein [Ardenticatenaceae bacterium]